MEHKIAKKICDKQYQVKFKASLPAKDDDDVPDPAAARFSMDDIGTCYVEALQSKIDSNCGVNAEEVYKVKMGDNLDWVNDEEEKEAIMERFKAWKKANK